jgi:hypothetical protein
MLRDPEDECTHPDPELAVDMRLRRLARDGASSRGEHI